MLVRTIVVAVPLVLGAGETGSTDKSDAAQGSSERQRPGEMTDSVPGHGHAAGAYGNSSDTTGAKGQGGAGSNSGTSGARKDETAAGEKGDTTSGAPSGRWDEGGGRSTASSGPSATGDRARAHEGDQTLTGKLSRLSDDSVTIESKGERHLLKIVPQTKFRIGGQDAQRAQLAEGQQVRASYAERGGDRIAVRIDASEATKAGADAKEKEKDEKGGGAARTDEKKDEAR